MKSSLLKFMARGQVAEALRDLVGEGLRVEPGVARRLLDLLAVLVGAGQEDAPRGRPGA